MAWIASAISVGTAVYGAAKSSEAAWNNYGAGAQSTLEIQKQMNQQAKIDEASRVAQAEAMIAQVASDNWQVENIGRQQEILKLQGKSESLIRSKNYNDTMEVAMVMGAASGRVFGVGSLGALFDKSAENFKFEQMWHADNEIISDAALEADKTNIYRAGNNTLIYGTKNTKINRLLSQNQQQMQSIQNGMQMNQQQQTFNRAFTQSVVGIGNAVGGAYRAYGSSLFDNPQYTDPRVRVYRPADEGVLY